MTCPYCGFRDSKVLDSREIDSGVRRRRQCPNCNGRFTTYERMQTGHPTPPNTGQYVTWQDLEKLQGLKEAIDKKRELEAAGSETVSGQYVTWQESQRRSKVMLAQEEASRAAERDLVKIQLAREGVYRKLEEEFGEGPPESRMGEYEDRMRELLLHVDVSEEEISARLAIQRITNPLFKISSMPSEYSLTEALEALKREIARIEEAVKGRTTPRCP